MDLAVLSEFDLWWSMAFNPREIFQAKSTHWFNFKMQYILIFKLFPSGRKSEKIYDTLGRMTYKTQLSSTETIPGLLEFYNGPCKSHFLSMAPSDA